MNKIAAAYKAAEQLSVLSKMDFSSEKTAEIDEGDLKDALIPLAAGVASNKFLTPNSGFLAYPITAAVMAPEGRGLSRVGHTSLGGLAGMTAGGFGSGLVQALSARLGMNLSPKTLAAINEAALTTGLIGGGIKGMSMSRENDPLYMKALRELGVDGYGY